MNCERCGKHIDFCVCSKVTPLKSKVSVLFFQHPQEPDHDLGSAGIAHQVLENSVLKIGLSVANLKAALGKENATPAKWGVLYLGSGVKEGEKTPEKEGMKGSEKNHFVALRPGLYPVRKDGTLLPKDEAKSILGALEGIILLDGTWSQAKTLWWRNSWLLKCRRLILVPQAKSLYGELRKEPRRECLSTIETTAEVLDTLGEDPAIGNHLRELFVELLKKYRASRPARRPMDRRRRR